MMIQAETEYNDVIRDEYLEREGIDRVPTVSKLWEFGETPTVDTMPWDGLYPMMPQKAAGTLMQPTVSVPTVPETW